MLLGSARQLAPACRPRSAPSGCPGPRRWRPALPGLLAAHAGRRVVRAGQRRPDVLRHRRRRWSRLLGPERGAGRSRTRRRCRWPAPGWAGRWRRPRSSPRRPARRAAAPRTSRRAAGCSCSAPTAATPAAVAALLDRARLRRQPADRAGPARRPGGAAVRPAPPRPGRTPATDPLVRDRRRGASPTRAPCRCRRCPACPTTRTSTTASSPSARSGRSPWPGSRPLPGQLLWDVGAGAGSIAIEWMRTAPVLPGGRGRARAGPGRADRAQRRPRSASPACGSSRAGRPRRWPACPRPTRSSSAAALTAPGCSTPAGRRCRRGGRLVANAVTLESEARAGRLRTRGTAATWSGSPSQRAAPVGGVHRLAAGDARDDQWAVTQAMTVHFIGAGPGRRRPDHRARRRGCIAAARSACTRAPRAARAAGRLPGRRPAGRHRRPRPRRRSSPSWSRAHEAGHDVARLHSGDPSVFSAMAEQMRRLDAAGRAVRRRPRRARVRRGRRRRSSGS